MDITVDGRKVHAATGGRAFKAGQSAVIFLHGAGQDHTSWQLPARWFAWHGYSVLAPDLPGHGRSEGPALTTVAELARWVVRLMDAAGLAKAALIGHSMGGGIALEVAAAEPQRVTQLAILGSALAMPVNEALLTAARDNPEAAHRMITTWGLGAQSRIGGNPAPGLWMTGGSMALLARNPAGSLYADFNACNGWTTGAAAAQRVRCPTLVVIGAGDAMTPAKAGRQLADSIAGSRTFEIANSGHMLMAEAPDAVLDALIEFFNSRA